VLRAPQAGIVVARAQIGDHLEEGQIVAEVRAGENGEASAVASPFKGVLRGLIRPGLQVSEGLKIGDVDSREDPMLPTLVSEKALAIGGGALEALLVFLKSKKE
jgi:xanthine dehydrogenase accessory factor